jgi:hypothetical protein
MVPRRFPSCIGALWLTLLFSPRLASQQSDLEFRIRNLEGDVSSLKGDVTSLETKVSRLESDVSSLENKARRLETFWRIASVGRAGGANHDGCCPGRFTSKVLTLDRYLTRTQTLRHIHNRNALLQALNRISARRRPVFMRDEAGEA